MTPESVWSSHPNLAYAALVAIPVTLFALWADYFERHIRWMQQEKVEFDAAEEIRKTRWMGFCGMACQGMVYLLSFTLSGVSRAVPFTAFVASIVTQHFIQAGLERRLWESLAPPQRQLATKAGLAPSAEAGHLEMSPGQGGRAIGWSLAAVFIYLAIIQTFVGLFAAAGAWLNLEKAELTLFILGGVVTGILAGLLVSFALAPFYLKRMLPLEPLREERWSEMVRACFERAGLKAPGAWLVGSLGGAWYQVFVSGFLRGRGVFSPALFMTRSILEKFSAEELRAAVLKEVSHVALGHFRRRFLAGFLGAVAAVLTSAAILALSYMYLPEPAIAVARLGAIFLPLLLPLALVRSRLLRHEREADLHAVRVLGADAEAMISMILKSDLLNGKIDLTGKFPAQSRRSLERIRALKKGLREDAARAGAGGSGEDRGAA